MEITTSITWIVMILIATLWQNAAIKIGNHVFEVEGGRSDIH
jgi:hypothetical protein